MTRYDSSRPDVLRFAGFAADDSCFSPASYRHAHRKSVDHGVARWRGSPETSEMAAASLRNVGKCPSKLDAIALGKGSGRKIAYLMNDN